MENYNHDVNLVNCMVFAIGGGGFRYLTDEFILGRATAGILVTAVGHPGVHFVGRRFTEKYSVQGCVFLLFTKDNNELYNSEHRIVHVLRQRVKTHCKSDIKDARLKSR